MTSGISSGFPLDFSSEISAEIFFRIPYNILWWIPLRIPYPYDILSGIYSEISSGIYSAILSWISLRSSRDCFRHFSRYSFRDICWFQHSSKYFKDFCGILPWIFYRFLSGFRFSYLGPWYLESSMTFFWTLTLQASTLSKYSQHGSKILLKHPDMPWNSSEAPWCASEVLLRGCEAI